MEEKTKKILFEFALRKIPEELVNDGWNFCRQCDTEIEKGKVWLQIKPKNASGYQMLYCRDCMEEGIGEKDESQTGENG